MIDLIQKNAFDIFSRLLDPVVKQKHRFGFLIINFLHFSFIYTTLFSVFFCFPSSSQSQSRTYEEYQVKAAFIYNFLLFTEWPEDFFESEDDPIDICILGENPFENHLNAIAESKKAKERNIKIRLINTVEEAEGCAVLFVSRSQEKQVEKIIASLDKKPVLTVADVENFSEAGGMVQLILVENKVNFVVNLKALNEAGLKMSSKLLDLAQYVIQD